MLPIDCNDSVPKKLLMYLRDNYYMSFFTEGDIDPSVEQKRKYAVMTNLGAKSVLQHWIATFSA